MRGFDFGGRMNGKVYTETVIYSAPEAFAKDAPYQIAIVTLETGLRVTGRIHGATVAIDNEVTTDGATPGAAASPGIPYFRKVK